MDMDMECSSRLGVGILLVKMGCVDDATDVV